jgi:uncharacterized protein YabN with tetrapyrrole methylase and pyrophosphatase domain
MIATSRSNIYILGLGIRGCVQITKETNEALSCCRKIYFGTDQPDVGDYLQSFGVELEDVHQFYKLGRPRYSTYQAIADAVIQTAIDNPPVALALYGHPMVCVATSRMIRQTARMRHLTVTVLPGISSFDCLLVDLNIDPTDPGLLQYEATHALLFQPNLDTTIPCIIWQIGVLETSLHVSSSSRPERFQRLQSYLRRFYPGHHEVALAVTSMSPLNDPDIHWVTIDCLPDAYERITGLTSLFIPPADKPILIDHDLALLLEDQGHADRLTPSPTESARILLRQLVRSTKKSSSVSKAGV